MMKTFELQPLTKSIVQLLLIALGLYALYLIKSIVIYGIIGLYISVLGRPIISLLRKIPKVQKILGDSLVAGITLVIIYRVFMILWVPSSLIKHGSN